MSSARNASEIAFLDFEAQLRRSCVSIARNAGKVAMSDFIQRSCTRGPIQDPDADILTKRSCTRDPYTEILYKRSYGILVQTS